MWDAGGCVWRGGGGATAQAALATDIAMLQDRLGRLNDLAEATRQGDALFAGLDPIAAAAMRLQFEALLDNGGLSQRRLLKSAQTAFDRVRDAAAWWKAA